ncbi:MFS transporter [bacterium SCSIO 12741]|nr:MFS transporter [bacterium SCSIO 12741]
MEQNQSFYTLQFWLLCASSVLFMASFNMIVPELNAFIETLGGGGYKGAIIYLFAFAALLARPFSGQLADQMGRIPVMIIGPLVCVILGILYPWATTVWGFLILRFFHGFSTGFKPTGTSAYLGDIVPANKRGEAMGILGVAGGIGMAGGPLIGGWLSKAVSLDAVFYASSGVAMLSILVLAGMKESLPKTKTAMESLRGIRFENLIDLSALRPSIIMFLLIFAFGVVLTTTSDFCDHLGIENRGMYLGITLFASIISRLFSGKWSDRWGRKKVLLIGTSILTIGIIVTGLSTTVNQFYIGAFIYGVSAGINSPTIFAWTIDLANDQNRGKAMATMFIALESGIIAGSQQGYFWYNNQPDRLPIPYFLAAVLTIIAFGLLVKWIRNPIKKS